MEILITCRNGGDVILDDGRNALEAIPFTPTVGFTINSVISTLHKNMPFGGQSVILDSKSQVTGCYPDKLFPVTMPRQVQEAQRPL